MYRIILSDLQSIGSVHRKRNSCLKKKKIIKLFDAKKVRPVEGAR